MTIVALDTYETVQELKAAGFTDDQATTVTRVMRRSQDLDLSNVATKTDLEIVKADVAVLKTDVAVLKTDVAVLKADVAVLKTDVAVLKTDVAVLKTDVAVLKTDVATLRTDLEIAKTTLQAQIMETRLALQAQMAETKADILKWIISAIGLQTVVILGVVVTLLKLFPN